MIPDRKGESDCEISSVVKPVVWEGEFYNTIIQVHMRFWFCLVFFFFAPPLSVPKGIMSSIVIVSVPVT